ncbi:hypothetical protein AU190_22265 [Mycolicibacterium acapulense]|nr:hypothetical protein AU190_22265 [Mycolicibacterium acapulense]
MTTTPAEKPADAPETTPAADDTTDTPNGADSDAQVLDGGDAQVLDDEQRPDDEDRADDDEDRAADDGRDTFPRKVVEKLRRQNTSLRDRAKAAEATVTALQQQAADKAIKAAGLKPRAVWAVAQLADVLADDGTVDAAKLSAAISTAKAELGVAPPKRTPPRPGAGKGLQSGAGVPQSKPRGFAAAFGPRPN